MRKHTFPSELENLTDAQLDQLHQWLDESPYRVALAKLETEFGVHMSMTKLCRYLQKLEFVEAINGDSETQLQVRDLIDILNGQRTPYDEATLAVISKKNLEYLLRKHEISVNKLMLCHRIATYKTNLDLTQRRLALNELKNGITPSSIPASNNEPNQSINSVAQPSASPAPPTRYTPQPQTSGPRTSANSAARNEHPKRNQKSPLTDRNVSLPAPLTDAEWSNLLSQQPPRALAPSAQDRHRPRPMIVRQALSAASDDPNTVTYPAPSIRVPTLASSPLPSHSELLRLQSLLPTEILTFYDAPPLPLAA